MRFRGLHPRAIALRAARCAEPPAGGTVVPHPPESTAGCRHPRNEPQTVAASAPVSRAAPDTVDPLLVGPPEPVPRTLSPEHWLRLGEGALLAAQPRVDWATLIRRTFLADVLTCPRCRGGMELVELVTDPQRAHEVLPAVPAPSALLHLAPDATVLPLPGGETADPAPTEMASDYLPAHSAVREHLGHAAPPLGP